VVTRQERDKANPEICSDNAAPSTPRVDPDYPAEVQVKITVWPIAGDEKPFNIWVDPDATIGQLVSKMKLEAEKNNLKLDNVDNCKLITTSGKPESFDLWDSYRKIMCCDPIRGMVDKKEPINLQLVRIMTS